MINEKWIIDEIDKIKDNNLFRSPHTVRHILDKQEKIIIEGEEFINFASNDYLNFSQNEYIKSKAVEYTQKYGTGSQASRVVVGTLDIHRELEKRIAKFKGCEDSLIFGSGFLTNVGIISALISRGDTIIIDRLAHASIIEGAILSRGDIKRFNHNDPTHLETLLKNSTQFKKSKTLVVTESIFSMDGDIAPLKKIVAICKKYSAMIMIDEAHSSGIYGENGAGLISELGICKDVNIAMGTFSKAFGVYGGFVAISKEIRSFLENRARSFIYSTALPPSVLGSINGALDILEKEALGKKLLEKATIFRDILRDANLNVANSESQIIPVIIGDTEKTIQFMDRLKRESIWVPAIRPPTVQTGTSRLRFSITLAHSDKLLKKVAITVIDIAKEEGVI